MLEPETVVAARRAPGEADRAARDLERVGVLDVGSNSVRLVIFDGAARSPAYFYNEKILCGLGASLAETGRLDPEGCRRALSAIRRFSFLAKSMGIEPLNCVATAAVRTAEDGAEFCEEVMRETGLRLDVASGEREARLSAQGVLLGWPDAEGLVCDIGGSSMELAEILDGRIRNCITSDLGPLALKRAAGEMGLGKYIGRKLKELRSQVGRKFPVLFLVGGSWRVIARLDMERRNYPLKVLHEYKMDKRSVIDTVKWIRRADLDKLRQDLSISPARMSLIPTASAVLKSLVRNFDPDQIAVSSYGIREGLLYDRMPDSLRRRDPLIEACRNMELSAARFPNFGDALYQFVLPLFASSGRERLRLVKAACLLHDTTWRAHPDYRAEICFDNATRANLGGLDHPGRVFLALALFHRYKNSRAGAPHLKELAEELLLPQWISEAEVLGKAMRFGSMFGVSRSLGRGRIAMRSQERRLVFHLPRELSDLYGEVAQSRFHALAKAMDCAPIVEQC
ncbi:MAG: Ppx/GppA family phosphatase [Albidovulum sp.]|nr:Ppx/GppA family phosphatase [Albidovulum sp.]MDE0533587.1 Ppx/GppA family phosphatase [Albidovulum sp.]